MPCNTMRAGFEAGESKYIDLLVDSRDRDTVIVVREARYELRRYGETVNVGDCEISRAERGVILSVLLAPPETGVYELEITYLIGPETLKGVVVIDVH